MMGMAADRRVSPDVQNFIALKIRLIRLRSGMNGLHSVSGFYRMLFRGRESPAMSVGANFTTLTMQLVFNLKAIW